MGFAFFLDGWNWFDLIVVALSLVPIVLLMFDSLDDSYNLAIFRILRVFRLITLLSLHTTYTLFLSFVCVGCCGYLEAASTCDLS